MFYSTTPMDCVATDYNSSPPREFVLEEVKSVEEFKIHEGVLAFYDKKTGKTYYLQRWSAECVVKKRRR